MHPDFHAISHLLGPDLITYDPYDLWKTKFGVWLRRLYYRKGKMAIPVVAPFALLDAYTPRLVRLFIAPQEYPIVRALAALSALNFYDITADNNYLDLASCSVRWLVANRSPGYHGACWGLNFAWENRGGHYPPTTPFITHTPYCVEALLRFHDTTGDQESLEMAVSALGFLEDDLGVVIDTDAILALSYGPGPEDVAVVNANSYAMLLYALLAPRIESKSRQLLAKATRICSFVTSRQNNDGSWLYYDGKAEGNFIDCFHTCFVLTNLHKYGELTGTNVKDVIERGLSYVVATFIDEKDFLARKFSLAANPSMTRYDLYDQAELLNLLTITGKKDLADRLYRSIMKRFYLPEKQSFGYQIDNFGILNKMNYLRWAVLPTVYALSEYYKAT